MFTEQELADIIEGLNCYIDVLNIEGSNTDDLKKLKVKVINNYSNLVTD